MKVHERCLHIILLFLDIAYIESYQAYDCTDPIFSGYQSTLVSKSCNEVQPDHLSERVVEGTILQQSLTKEVEARVCKRLRVEREVYCNWMIVAEAKVDPVNIQGFEGAALSVSECSSAFDHGFITQGGTIIYVRPNDQVVYTDTKKLDKNGLCTKWHGTVRFNTYVLEITRKNITLTSGLDSAVESYLVDGSTIKKDAHESSGTTTEGHTVMWDGDRVDNCFMNKLYQGPVSIVSDDIGTEQALVKDKGVGLTLAEEVVICNLHMTSTNIPFVYYLGHVVTAFPPIEDFNNVLLFSESKAMIQGLLTSSALNLEKTSGEIRRSICELEQRVNRDVLDSIHTDPDSAAFKQLGVRGWRMVKAGAATGLLKCAMVSVKVFPQNLCFLDVPVHKEETDQLFYMDALTGVLHPSSMSVPCDDPRVPIIKIGEQWIRVAQTVTPVSAPAPFVGYLTQRSKHHLRTAKGLASELLVKKKIIDMSVDAAKRKGQFKLTAEQSEFFDHHDSNGIIRSQLGELSQSMVYIHWRNILAICAPLVIFGLLILLVCCCKNSATRVVVHQAIPEIERLKQYLPARES